MYFAHVRNRPWTKGCGCRVVQRSHRPSGRNLQLDTHRHDQISSGPAEENGLCTCAWRVAA
eukprot:903962-Pyramimonas_sp.AAC.1